MPPKTDLDLDFATDATNLDCAPIVHISVGQQRRAQKINYLRRLKETGINHYVGDGKRCAFRQGTGLTEFLPDGTRHSVTTDCDSWMCGLCAPRKARKLARELAEEFFARGIPGVEDGNIGFGYELTEADKNSVMSKARRTGHRCIAVPYATGRYSIFTTLPLPRWLVDGVCPVPTADASELQWEFARDRLECEIAKHITIYYPGYCQDGGDEHRLRRNKHLLQAREVLDARKAAEEAEKAAKASKDPRSDTQQPDLEKIGEAQGYLDDLRDRIAGANEEAPPRDIRRHDPDRLDALLRKYPQLVEWRARRVIRWRTADAALDSAKCCRDVAKFEAACTPVSDDPVWARLLDETVDAVTDRDREWWQHVEERERQIERWSGRKRNKLSKKEKKAQAKDLRRRLGELSQQRVSLTPVPNPYEQLMRKIAEQDQEWRRLERKHEQEQEAQRAALARQQSKIDVAARLAEMEERSPELREHRLRAEAADRMCRRIRAGAVA